MRLIQNQIAHNVEGAVGMGDSAADVVKVLLRSNVTLKKTTTALEKMVQDALKGNNRILKIAELQNKKFKKIRDVVDKYGRGEPWAEAIDGILKL